MQNGYLLMSRAIPKPRIAHLTSAHPRFDTRIFIKQCRSLASHDYDVSLVVADGKGDEYKEGVHILDAGHLPGRLNRIFKSTKRVFQKAIALNADIYHLHDPELIPTGLKLKRLGKKVIFDSHEDVPKQMLGKPYLGPIRLHIIAYLFSIFERYACRRFDGVIAATPVIRNKFLLINPRTKDINNFPLPNELATNTPWDMKAVEVCYVGSIGTIRGAKEIIAALSLVQTPVRLNLCGQFDDSMAETDAQALPGWQRVNALGFINRTEVREVLERSIAGLVTLHPVINYLDALPVKMFEYMAAGIPVIASNFPLWRGIIEGSGCGLCIDPLDPAAIAHAIDYLISNPEEARRMGENGRAAVMNQYNWPTEEKKLLAFYADLLSNGTNGRLSGTTATHADDNSITAWIFQTGEPLHIDEGDPRPMRAMNLANALVGRGHRVVLWSSAFFHQEKRHRSKEYRVLQVSDQMEIRLIPSMGYERNIGLGRLADHAQLAINLKRALKHEKSMPDVAFVGYPPIELAAVATGWLKKRGVPSLLDAKDQWPDAFIEPFPAALKPMARLGFAPYFYLGRKAMRQATALSSMAASFLNWMRLFSQRQPNEFDGVFPLSPSDEHVAEEDVHAATEWWAERGIANDDRKRFFFVGSLSRAFDFTPIQTAAKSAREHDLNCQFVICGDGGAADEVRKLFAGLDNVVLPGWIDRPKIVALSRLSMAGLAPYRNLPDFQKSVPNKVIDYMALGQPVISPLGGEVQALIDQNGVGLLYNDADSTSLFACLQRLSTENDLRARLSTSATTTYQEHFSGKKVYGDLVTRLEKLAESKNEKRDTPTSTGARDKEAVAAAPVAAIHTSDGIRDKEIE